MYNLTDNQKDVLKWLISQVREGNLEEEFSLVSLYGGLDFIGQVRFDRDKAPVITKGTIDALHNDKLLHCQISYSNKTGVESSRRCTLTGKAYEAIDSNFDAPDNSFVKHITPLADITHFDAELKSRCLPILGTGAANEKAWDNAVRNAGVVLEERLREIGGISDSTLVGRDLVNKVFGQHGTLANKIPHSSEQVGHRDLYAGIVGVFRNPSAHRFIDFSPEEGGAILVFMNLLLKKLEQLR
ncbi:TIGR02391 family protein [Catalinimonas alkaloidigena]|uniref:TIGR02391 family protein n=1 Tax=Catalinimonas alkaloidigena TaxID=1075417 RepID=A0A1G9R7T1_9BACT|nr:TIGR02391 family protein [Catalinimonas alkaloidigena]SDM19349.1 TIGR02391 family protein [Catalinimonas alkaloidigena]